MGKGKISYPEEFLIQQTSWKHLNRDVYKFRQEHPDYEVFTISISGTGGQMGGTLHYNVIWRMKVIPTQE